MNIMYRVLLGAGLLLSPLLGFSQECTPHEQLGLDTPENALFNEAGGQQLADDFSVSANVVNFNATQVKVNTLAMEPVASYDVVIYSDNNGAPGAIFDAGFTSLTPTESELIGDAFGYNMYRDVIEFPSAIVLPGGSVYWLQIIANPGDPDNQTGWEAQTETVTNSVAHYIPAGGTEWSPNSTGYDLVFTISGECEYVEGCWSPEDIEISNVGPTSADMSWTGYDATEWVVEYGPAGFTQGEGTEVTVTTPSVTLDNLESLTAYDAHITAICEDETESDVQTISFSTTDFYCTPVVAFNVEPITHVNIADIDNYNSANPEDNDPVMYFLDQEALLTHGETYTVTLEGFTDGDWTNAFTVFIDWNQDGEFNNEDERFDIGTITNSTGEDGQQAIGDIEVPFTALTGTTRMRVSKQYNAFVTDACEEIGYGQVHDYSVTVEQSETCTPHQQVSNGFENGSNITDQFGPLANDFTISGSTESFEAQTITVNMLADAGIGSLDVAFYNDDEGSVGTEYGTPFTGLEASSIEVIGEAFDVFTVYKVVIELPTPVTFTPGGSDATYWLQIVAAPGEAEGGVFMETTTQNMIGAPTYRLEEGVWEVGESDGVFSITGDCSYIEGCFEPTNVLISDIQIDGAHVSWMPNGAAEYWIVEYGEPGYTPGEGTSFTAYAPMVDIDGLDVHTDYDLYVKAVCGEDEETAWVGPISFTSADFYCSVSVSQSVEPITFVGLEELENSTDAEIDGSSPAHEYFLDMIATVERGATHTIAIEGNSGGNYLNAYTVFIDWNQDHVFDPETERYEIGTLAATTGEDGTQVVGDIEVPGEATLGSTRMRVIKMYVPSEMYAEDACATIGYGQIEDYTVIVEQGDFAGVDCTPHQQVPNNFENGMFNQSGGQMLADDFKVGPNVEMFTAQSMTFNMITQGGIDSYDILFYADDNGTPGEPYGSGFAGLTTSSETYLGTEFGYDFYEVTVDFPTSIDFPGGGGNGVTYWVQIISYPTDTETNAGWESTTANIIGNPAVFNNENVDDWTAGDMDMVFSISGQCFPIEACFAPDNVTASDITTESMVVSWVQADDASEWLVEYGPAGFTQGEGIEITTTEPTVTLTDLTEVTTYDVYIQAICGDEDVSEWSGPNSYTTLDIYCVVPVDVTVEPITYVEFAGIENSTTASTSAPGHEYFTNLVAEVTPGESYLITVEGYTGGNYENFVSVFFDWDMDGEFNNEDERYDIGLLINTTGTDGQQLINEITVPSGISLGTTRMRVVKNYFENTTDACAALDWGQIEDYTVEVGPESVSDFDKFDFAFGPNPTTQSLNLRSQELIENVTFYNILGQMVMNEAIHTTSHTFDLSNLGNGAYFMEVTIQGERKTFKVIMQR